VPTRCRRQQQRPSWVRRSVLSQPARKAPRASFELARSLSLSRQGQGWWRENACACRGCGLSLAVNIGRWDLLLSASTRHDIALLRQVPSPVRSVSLVVAGTSPAGPVVATSTTVWCGRPWLREDTTINLLCLLSVSLATPDSRLRLRSSGAARMLRGCPQATPHPAPTTTQLGCMSSRQRPLCR
jgi:hypothetical protein